MHAASHASGFVPLGLTRKPMLQPEKQELHTSWSQPDIRSSFVADVLLKSGKYCRSHHSAHFSRARTCQRGA